MLRTALAKGADSTELAAFFALFQEMQWVLDQPLQRRIVTMTPAQFRNNRQQWALKVGRTWLLLGDSSSRPRVWRQRAYRRRVAARELPRGRAAA